MSLQSRIYCCHALEKGFRPEDMDEGSLKITVMNYLSSEKAKNEILTNAFHWQKSKMVYLLYKFELSIDEKVLIDLRETIKDSISIEHILPQGWEWEWINADVKNLSDENKEFEKRIYNTINGIGNLIILTNSENSSQSNNHPKNKTYELQDFGSYKKHKEKQTEWGNHENWVELINIRGEDIYEFMISYFDLQSI